jgi:hypothetical protein
MNATPKGLGQINNALLAVLGISPEIAQIIVDRITDLERERDQLRVRVAALENEFLSPAQKVQLENLRARLEAKRCAS